MKVIRFSAIWCSGCLVMRPRWKKIEAELTWLQTEDYDYDQDKDMLEKYGIGKEIPVFIFLDKDGVEFERMKGEVDRRDLLKFLEANKEK